MKTKALLISIASIVTLQARTERDCDRDWDWYERQEAEDNAKKRHKEAQQQRDWEEHDRKMEDYRRQSEAKKAREAAERAAAENARQLEKIQQKLEELEGGKPWSPKR